MPCVAFAGFIATLDDGIVAISLPAISADLGATTGQVAQVTIVALLALAGADRRRHADTTPDAGRRSRARA